jgi:hypothetical protein
MGAAHFLMKTRVHVSTEMSLHVLAYNLRRVMAIFGTSTTVSQKHGIIGASSSFA